MNKCEGKVEKAWFECLKQNTNMCSQIMDSKAGDFKKCVSENKQTFAIGGGCSEEDVPRPLEILAEFDELCDCKVQQSHSKEDIHDMTESVPVVEFPDFDGVYKAQRVPLDSFDESKSEREDDAPRV